MVCCCSNFLPVVVQDSKIDAVKSEKVSAAAAPKRNGLDIVSITCDGCEIPFIALLYTF